VHAILVRLGVRLVTLTGPGGIGKTRLALAVAELVRGEYPDGVYWVPLASIRDADLVPSAILRALILPEGGGDPLDVLCSHLRSRRLLLLLDNFEQVVSAAPIIAALLAAAPGITMLVTSRAVLRLNGEHDYPVPTLSLADPDHLPTPDQLIRYDAVRLFVERARAVKPKFRLDDTNAEAIAAICHRLDGLPLAIELAASRVRLMPPAAILSRLRSRLGFLTGGARDLPERQRTLRHTIEWSYSLLGANERRLFSCLGVFAGGWTLEAAESVCVKDDGQVLEEIGSLLDESLIQYEPTSGGEPRFRMLGTIREYALERLGESGDADAVYRRAARYYLELAERSERGFRSPRQVELMRVLEVEHPNTGAVMEWLLDQRDWESAVRLAWSSWLFWFLRGHVREGRRWMEKVLSVDALVPATRATAMHVLGSMLYAQGDLNRAASVFEECADIFRGLGNRVRVASSLVVPGQVALFQGNYARATALLEESLAIHREENDLWTSAMVLTYLGMIPLSQGDPGRATRLFQEAMTLARELGDGLLISVSFHNMALAAVAQGDTARAIQLFGEALNLAYRMGDSANMAYCLEGLAALAGAPGSGVEGALRAARLFGAAEALLENAGDPIYSYTPDRTHHTQVVAAARAQTDAATWEAAWAEVRALELQRVIEYALDGMDSDTPVDDGHKRDRSPSQASNSRSAHRGNS
jgi:predicted ATPase